MELWIVWLIAAVILLSAEVLTTDLVAVWFGIAGLLCCLLAAIFPSLHIIWQILIFAFISTVLIILTRPLVKKIMQRKKGQETNLELIIGHTAMVTERIDNDKELGAVKINGLVWTARSVDGCILEESTLVTVCEIKGNKAFVIKTKKEN